MWRSLRVRLLLMLLLVVVVAVGTVALFSSRATTNQFERYLERDVARDQAVLSTLLAQHSQNPDRDRLQPLVEQMGQAMGDQIVLADMKGEVIADSEGKLIGQFLPLPAPPVSASTLELLPPEQAPPGFLAPLLPDPLPFNVYVMPRDRLATGTSEAGFISSVNRSLVLAVVAATLVALLLTMIFSRRMLGPIEALTAAARRMERGDLNQRVRIRSGDEIGQLAHAFNGMADGLARLDRLRRSMASDIAHELRTPLSNIRGYLEALQDQVLQPTPRLIASIHEESTVIAS